MSTNYIYSHKQLGNVLFVLECYSMWFITEKWVVLNSGK